MNPYETHVPTQQTQKKKKIWLSSPNEDSGWQKSHSSSSPIRPKSSCRLKFSKRHKLRKRSEFQKIFKQGKRVPGRYMCVDVLVSTTTRIGITTPSKFGSAPERNRFKRLIREAFRLNQHLIPSGLEWNICPRQLVKKASFHQVQEEFLRLISC